ncbi:thaumatin family protein [Streptomyces sp. NPDC088400]|uniref:thaumatin family protein n=1 Tax=Streptomyces sp. NPDC088400 TaxID=3365861 RepID=UPI00381E436B
MNIRSALAAVLLAFTCVLAGTAGPGAHAAVAAEHTVTFVNKSAQRVWIGSTVNADGSAVLTGLPALDSGRSATITIPENSGAGHWRGKFFARTGCGGNSGSTFHCKVADCGPYADRCSTAEQPASLAEFNFDPRDSLAPWYNVSYVNAVSLPVTITPVGVAPPPDGGECAEMGCSNQLLPYCPPENLTKDPATGAPMLCVNPNRDAQTNYSRAINAQCPKAYAWSKQDTVPGNQVMRQCRACSGFTVTFH